MTIEGRKHICQGECDEGSGNFPFARRAEERLDVLASRRAGAENLIRTFAVLYELGYSLDNLSLMALTIAVGFVVDDAVVVIENVHRYLEEGLSPVDAALQGAGEIGATKSLIAELNESDERLLR